jgi:plasmid stabilization system protein ParE
MKVIFHADAKKELTDARNYYNKEKPGLGLDLVREVRHATARVKDNPLQFGEIESGIRCCQVARFPYGVVYSIYEQVVMVHAVMHLHREPGYWRHRLQ